MAALSDYFSSYEGPIAKARQTNMSDMSDGSVSIDRECFSALPKDTLLFTGSSFRGIHEIHKIIKDVCR
jgi:hypothetical protein